MCHKTGLWKVSQTGDTVEPYDALAKKWSRVVEAECNPNLKKDLATPLPRIADAQAASVGLWSHLDNHKGIMLLQLFYATAAIIGMIRWYS